MGKQLAFVRRGAALLAMVVVMGCSGVDLGERPVPPTASEDVLSTLSDTARGRVWVLGPGDLRVYDAATSKLVRRIVLPGWSMARYECNPGLALDASGSAIVSNNVVPTLWRVEGDSFQVSEQAFVLEGREGWDIGFGPIALAADGSIYALTSNRMSLWKLDAVGGRASLVETYVPPSRGCRLPALSISRLERSGS